MEGWTCPTYTVTCMDFHKTAPCYYYIPIQNIKKTCFLEKRSMPKSGDSPRSWGWDFFDVLGDAAPWLTSTNGSLFLEEAGPELLEGCSLAHPLHPCPSPGPPPTHLPSLHVESQEKACGGQTCGHWVLTAHVNCPWCAVQSSGPVLKPVSPAKGACTVA
jgi:hypothetical protein